MRITLISFCALVCIWACADPSLLETVEADSSDASHEDSGDGVASEGSDAAVDDVIDSDDADVLAAADAVDSSADAADIDTADVADVADVADSGDGDASPADVSPPDGDAVDVEDRLDAADSLETEETSDVILPFDSVDLDSQADTTQDTTLDTGVEPSDAADADAAILPPLVRLVLATESTVLPVGAPVGVTCSAVSADGTRSEPAPRAALLVSPSGRVRVQAAPLALEGRTPGTVQAQCVDPTARLLISDPVEFDVVTGPPVSLFAVIDTLSPEAGVPFQVSCMAEDAAGNLTELESAEVSVRRSRSSHQFQRDGNVVTLLTVATFEMVCQVDGLQSEGLAVRPRPGLASAWRTGLQGGGGTPHRISIGGWTVPWHEFLDAWGNVTSRGTDRFEVRWSISPDVPLREDRSWQFLEEGSYVATATWLDNSSVRDSRDIAIVVTGVPPLLTCDNPTHLSSITAAAGTEIALVGTAFDDVGVAQVTVNGQVADLDSEGVWEIRHIVQPGINLLDVRAAAFDLGGTGFPDRSALVCAFIASSSYVDGDSTLTGAVRLRLGREALDDGAPGVPPRSVADLLSNALAPATIAPLIDDQLDASSRLWSGCIVPNPFGGCLNSGTLTYLGPFTNRGPNRVSLSVASSRLRFTVTINDVTVPTRLVVTGLPNTTVTLRVSTLTVGAEYTLSITSGGILRATQNRIVRTTVGDLSATFSPTNSLYSLAFDLAEATIRTELQDAMDGAFAEIGADVLNDALGSFALTAIGGFLESPPFLDGDPVLSRLTLQPNAVSLLNSGIDLRFDGSITSLDPNEDVHPPGELARLNASSPVMTDNGFAVYLNLDLFNQGLARLWRAGYFDVELADLTVPVFSGTSTEYLKVDLIADIAPMLSVRDGQLWLSMAGLRTTIFERLLAFTGLTTDARIGAEFRVAVEGDGQGGFALTGLELVRIISSVSPIQYSTGEIDAVSGFLVGQVDLFGTIGGLADLVSLPLPAIVGSTATVPLGLQPGQSFGLTNTTVSFPTHFLRVAGSLGVIQ